MFGKNIKTSLAGLGMILTAIADILMGVSSDTHVINWQLVITAIIAGLGLFNSKDSNVTGGTIMQASSTQAIQDKMVEQQAPELTAVLYEGLPASDTPIPEKADIEK